MTDDCTRQYVRNPFIAPLELVSSTLIGLIEPLLDLGNFFIVSTVWSSIIFVSASVPTFDEATLPLLLPSLAHDLYKRRKPVYLRIEWNLLSCRLNRLRTSLL